MSPLTLPVIARSAATKQSTLWRKIRSITVAVVQRSAIICLAEPLFGILSTRRLTRASELSLKTTSELESVRTEVCLEHLEGIGSRQHWRKIRRAGKNMRGRPEA